MHQRYYLTARDTTAIIIEKREKDKPRQETLLTPAEVSFWLVFLVFVSFFSLVLSSLFKVFWIWIRNLPFLTSQQPAKRNSQGSFLLHIFSLSYFFLFASISLSLLRPLFLSYSSSHRYFPRKKEYTSKRKKRRKKNRKDLSYPSVTVYISQLTRRRRKKNPCEKKQRHIELSLLYTDNTHHNPVCLLLPCLPTTAAPTLHSWCILMKIGTKKNFFTKKIHTKIFPTYFRGDRFFLSLSLPFFSKKCK